jgi:CBS-domain-containing membrane protein
MRCTMIPIPSARLMLRADTAEDLMTPNPVSLREYASLREAMQLLVEHGFCAAPVIDDAGRPLGVLSRSDLLIHDCETSEYCREMPEFYRKEEIERAIGEKVQGGFQVEKVDRTRVADIMTPAVFSVHLDTPVATVLHDLLMLRVHRLFVVDDQGVLVGVISTFDLLKHMASELD